MNSGICTEDKEILNFFDSYPKLTQKINYLNNFNKKLSKNINNQTIKSDFDNKVLDFIRKELSSVTRSNISIVTANITGAIIPESKLEEIAKIFYQSMLDCNFLIDELLECLIKINFPVVVYKTIISLIINEFKMPTIFEDSYSETGKDKSYRIRLANCIIMAKIYKINNELLTIKDEEFYNNFILPLISIKNESDIIILSHVLVLVLSKLKLYSNDYYNDILSKIKIIMSNTDYKLSNRLKLRNIN